MDFPKKQEFKFQCDECGTVVTIKDVDEEEATVNLLSLTPWTTKGVGEGFRCPHCSIEHYEEMTGGDGYDVYDPQE
jgi:predicted RNA-binding Zn-ribbon protein involved in translation (DUF1610 family)